MPAGTITLRKNVTLEGFGDINLFTNNEGVNHKNTVIFHKLDFVGTDLFVTDVPHTFGYIGSIGVKNINLYGTV